MSWIFGVLVIIVIAVVVYAQRPLKPTVEIEGRILRDVVGRYPNGDSYVGVLTPSGEELLLLYATRDKSFCSHQVGATCFHGEADMLFISLEFGSVLKVRTFDTTGTVRRVHSVVSLERYLPKK